MTEGQAQTLREWFAQWQASDSDARFLLLIIFVLLVGWLSYNRERHGETDSQSPTSAIRPPRGRRVIGARQIARRLMRDPIQLGNVWIEWFEQHLGIVATTGGFKTTLLAQIIRQLVARGRPVVVITGGESTQLEVEIRAAGGWIIRPHNSPLRFNAFEGSAEFFAQGWAGLFPTNSEAKVYHSAFEIAAIKYGRAFNEKARRLHCSGECEFCALDALDLDEYSPEEIADIRARKKLARHDGLKRFILAYEPEGDIGKKLWAGMKEGYVGIRLELMDLAFGDWLGTELSILDAIEQGVPLCFVLDASEDQDLNRFSAALVWQAVVYAVRMRGHFDVVVDELGRLPEELVGTQVRTFRVADVHCVIGTHSEADFTPIIGDLFQSWCLGKMTAAAIKTRAWAHQLTWREIPAQNFGSHALERMDHRLVRLWNFVRRKRSGHFYVVDGAEQRVQVAAVPTYRAPTKHIPRRSMRHLRALTKQPANEPNKPAFGSRSQPAVLEPVAPSLERGTAPTQISLYKTYRWPIGPVELPRWVSGPNVERKLAIYSKFYALGTSDDACVESTYALKGKGKRPGCEYDGRDWQVYDLVLALDDCAVQGFDRQEEKAYLAQVKMHLGAGILSCDHTCENRRCVKRSHHEWEKKADNTALYWERRRAEKRQAKEALVGEVVRKEG